MDKKSLQDLIEADQDNRNPNATIVLGNNNQLTINDHLYELIMDHKNAFNHHEVSDRFSSYYFRFDYLLGDLGFEQLRLRGFYDNDRNVQSELKIEALQDFLLEKANPGCAYFVLHNLNMGYRDQENNRKPSDINSYRRRRRNLRSTKKLLERVRETVKPKNQLRALKDR